MKAKELSIVFGILARDCKDHLVNNISRVEKLGEMFKDYHVIIYENDSKDGTTEIVQRWGVQNPNVVAITEVTNSVTIPQATAKCPCPAKGIHRIQKMAGFRNRLMEELEKRFAPDLFCQIDIDIISFNPDDVIYTIENAPEDWGGLFGNGIVYWHDGEKVYESPFQYDSFAYVKAGDDYRNFKDFTMTDEFHPQVAYMMTKSLEEIDKYLPCESAFNGIGIYKYEAIKGLRYTTYQTPELKKVNGCLCEHIPFNGEVRKRGYGIYISKTMRIEYIHFNMDEIINNLLIDYRGYFEGDKSKLKPGIIKLLNTWGQSRNTEKVNSDIMNLNNRVAHLEKKRRKYRRLTFSLLVVVVALLVLIAGMSLFLI